MINNQILGVIDETTYKHSLQDLAAQRSLGAIPFAGRYRLIDFMLSNMVNADIRSVAIFPKYRYRSLMDHLGAGKEWDLHRKKDGLFFFPSPHLHHEYDEFGSFRQFSDHLDYFHRSSQQYAVITNSHTVCNIQFKYVLKRHQEAGCDITEVYQDGQSLQIYLMSSKLLKDLIYGHAEKGYKTIQEAVEKESSTLTVCPYEYSGYAAVIDSVEKYYLHSMQLIQPSFWQQVFLPQLPIYTKVKDEPPTKYGKHSAVRNSLVANGCVLEGEVENCILFRGVHVGKGTKLKNCIIMQKTQIGEDCVLEQVISDKDVRIGNATEAAGTIEQPLVLKKGLVQGELMNS
ncbi:glucose-1-phosphate adenylyltransferase subunit GlgD [Bacillus atrophaeus]|uniref:Glucose-1-phosphate adenylyltransferase (ADP-glucose pyrophosphorylase) beta subunit n=1 Tax=Bacillus atrophaeus (strain 1942) TaxID=720555 RepID=A0ABM5M0C8_BACA1|nr:glucose-1-phosphate adenylyltransferase subunit GlgD [Bacillus atrophaeus]AMR61683.1 glucose-1-phosphate adenylyltransferase [Bacillus subtilis subsp. globigii]ADP33581.1 glucose-1-phosphate adenylyltransferase (ADP-glucose pyrophosphorylase) beta subunit [Bacillus atrophaeus 1942]AIK46015.1 glucose-1-phosphate adenylyltransferase, GlgD subunit [Bacillus atrophaeus subsp. globigii]EIM12806.1 glucose-1-phosphate adenylyltransferase [Bacillus atrophaeus C89]KFK82993.1 glucose-1-phosphate aden